MNEELNKQLAALEERLGVTTDHLWGVLIKQAYIDGLGSLATALFCVLAGAVALYAFVILRAKFKGRVKELGANLSGVVMEPIGFLILGVILLVLFTIASNNLYWALSDFVNPEYFAFRQLPFSK